MLDIIDGLDFLSTFKQAVEITGLGEAFERNNLQATLLVPTNGVRASLNKPWMSELCFDEHRAE